MKDFIERERERTLNETKKERAILTFHPVAAQERHSHHQEECLEVHRLRSLRQVFSAHLQPRLLLNLVDYLVQQLQLLLLPVVCLAQLPQQLPLRRRLEDCLAPLLLNLRLVDCSVTPILLNRLQLGVDCSVQRLLRRLLLQRAGCSDLRLLAIIRLKGLQVVDLEELNLIIRQLAQIQVVDYLAVLPHHNLRRMEVDCLEI